MKKVGIIAAIIIFVGALGSFGSKNTTSQSTTNIVQPTVEVRKSTVPQVNVEAPTITLAPTATPTPSPTPHIFPTATPTPVYIQPVESSPCAGASAICSDGTCSYSAHRQGTCSHHGGVAEWL